MGASSELPFYDGTNLAKKDVVLVSINHRLNFLGYLDLSDFGEKYKYSGVAGVMDMVKALEWVHKNIEGFGGDPDNVTIFGQSGGGGKVNILLGTPSAKGLFHRGIIESGSMTNLMGPEKARSMGRKVVEKLGLDAKTIDKIQEIPYSELLAAATDAVIEENPENIFYRWYGAGMWCSPVLDGEVIPYPLTDERVAEFSKGLPTIIGCNFSENNMLPAVYANADMRFKMGDTKQYLYIFAKSSPHMDGTFATNQPLHGNALRVQQHLAGPFHGGGRQERLQTGRFHERCMGFLRQGRSTRRKALPLGGIQPRHQAHGRLQR